MAIDVYLQIDGIKGESTDERHPGWIELTSAIWSIAQPQSTSASTAGGHTAGRCERQPLTVTKLADLASPILMQHCAMGKTLPKARLEFLRADGAGKPVKYYQVDLDNVLIASLTQSAHEGTILCDVIGLAFGQIKWTYTQQKISGGAGGSTLGGWNFAANKVAS